MEEAGWDGFTDFRLGFDASLIPVFIPLEYVLWDWTTFDSVPVTLVLVSK